MTYRASQKKGTRYRGSITSGPHPMCLEIVSFWGVGRFKHSQVISMRKLGPQHSTLVLIFFVSCFILGHPILFLTDQRKPLDSDFQTNDCLKFINSVWTRDWHFGFETFANVLRVSVSENLVSEKKSRYRFRSTFWYRHSVVWNRLNMWVIRLPVVGNMLRM